MKFHPIADIFPMMDPVAFEELAEDIKLNGLLHPIITFEDKVLDGRNRLKACYKAGVAPTFAPYEGGDPLAFVISLNLQRRHLDESQRAVVGWRIATMKLGDNQHKKGGSSNSPTLSQASAAKLVRVSVTSIGYAAKVGASGTKKLLKAVEDGKIAVSVAAKLAGQD